MEFSKLPAGATLVLETALGPVLTLRAAGAVARVALHGATVLSFVPDTGASAGRDLLWLSPNACAAEGKAIRGGIPLCGPWFGPHPIAAGAPVHGLLRTRPWTLRRVEPWPEGKLRAEFALDLPAGISADWPYSATLTFSVVVGASLEIELTTRNTGTKPFLLSGALHTYLAVGDVRQARIEGLADREYLDFTNAGARGRHGLEPIVLERESARFYFSGASTRVVDPVLNREIQLQGFGAAATVVWNPWAGTAAKMPDVGARWPEFLCVENANLQETAVPLAPAQSHHLGAAISA